MQNPAIKKPSGYVDLNVLMCWSHLSLTLTVLWEHITLLGWSLSRRGSGERGYGTPWSSLRRLCDRSPALCDSLVPHICGVCVCVLYRQSSVTVTISMSRCCVEQGRLVVNPPMFFAVLRACPLQLWCTRSLVLKRLACVARDMRVALDDVCVVSVWFVS